MKFIPYEDKAVIEPIHQEGIIITADERFLECGIVIAVGDKVKFLKKGDSVFFDAWGHTKIKDSDGKEFHVISCNEEIIFGKYESKQK